MYSSQSSKRPLQYRANERTYVLNNVIHVVTSYHNTEKHRTYVRCFLECGFIFSVTSFCKKIKVLEIYHNGIVFDIAFFANMVDDFCFCKRSVLFEYCENNVLYHTGSVSPFGERVESATNEYEAVILDEFGMRCHAHPSYVHLNFRQAPIHQVDYGRDAW